MSNAMPTGTQSPAQKDVAQLYTQALDQEVPPPLAAIFALTEMIASQSASTTSHLLMTLHHNSTLLLSSPKATYGTQAGVRLFERWVRDSVGTAGRGATLDEMRAGIVEEGRKFAKNGAGECREKIAREVQGFLKDDCTILTHSFSRVVLLTLKKAMEQNKRVNVYVTEARPGCGGLKTHAALTALGIPCTVVLDSAVGYVMDRVDLVLVGSEVVVESGGLVAGVGTYQMALLSRALNKPFYCLAESYKFLRLFPLSQQDLPSLPFNSSTPSALPFQSSPSAISSKPASSLPLSFKNNLVTPLPSPTASSSNLPLSPSVEDEKKVEKVLAEGMTQGMKDDQPSYDYTPREFISLVMSDVGILTPSSVSAYCGIFTE